MGKAGKALKQVMTAYSISQNQLAEAMEIDRSNISRWSSETRDPGAETLLEIRREDSVRSILKQQKTLSNSF